jgi:hypothetical protein
MSLLHLLGTRKVCRNNHCGISNTLFHRCASEDLYRRKSSQRAQDNCIHHQVQPELELEQLVQVLAQLELALG